MERAAYREALKVKRDALRVGRIQTRAYVQDDRSYMENPGLSDHDKELQSVLDYDLEHPNAVMRRLREEYDRLAAFVQTPYTGGFWSLTDEMERLVREMSDEAVAEREAEYREYVQLREEALAKGFVRGGNCENVGRMAVHGR